MSKIQPKGSYVLVKLDPAKELSELVHMPEKGNVRTGVITAKGDSPSLGELAVGDRVAFLRWHMEHQNGKALSYVVQSNEEDCMLLNVNDILMVIEGAVPSLDVVAL